MAAYYCKYCGAKSSSVAALTSAFCMRHPLGGARRHELYEGSEKTRYICKYCGQSFPSIAGLTSAMCFRHPNGTGKGRHSPAL